MLTLIPSEVIQVRMTPCVRSNLVAHVVSVLDTLGLVVVVDAIPCMQVNVVRHTLKIFFRKGILTILAV
jgi:hypothetical protein